MLQRVSNQQKKQGTDADDNRWDQVRDLFYVAESGAEEVAAEGVYKDDRQESTLCVFGIY